MARIEPNPDTDIVPPTVTTQFAGCGLSTGHFAKRWGMLQRPILFIDLSLYSCPRTNRGWYVPPREPTDEDLANDD
jgi:hypothetical protein